MPAANESQFLLIGAILEDPPTDTLDFFILYHNP